MDLETIVLSNTINSTLCPKKAKPFSLFFATSLVVWYLLSDFNVFTVAVRNALCKKYCFVKTKIQFTNVDFVFVTKCSNAITSTWQSW